MGLLSTFFTLLSAQDTHLYGPHQQAYSHPLTSSWGWLLEYLNKKLGGRWRVRIITTLLPLCKVTFLAVFLAKGKYFPVSLLDKTHSFWALKPSPVFISLGLKGNSSTDIKSRTVLMVSYTNTSVYVPFNHLPQIILVCMCHLFPAGVLLMRVHSLPCSEAPPRGWIWLTWNEVRQFQKGSKP